MLRLVLLAVVSLVLAGSAPPAEARPAQKKSATVKKKKKVASKKAKPAKRKKKPAKKKKRSEPSEPRRPMP